MVNVLIVLPDELNKKLREAIAKRYGTFKRGHLSQAVAEAIELWLARENYEVLESVEINLKGE